MEDTESTAGQERTTETNGDQGTYSNVLMSNKPLHRFVQREPRSLGVTRHISQVVNKQLYTSTAIKCDAAVDTDIHPSSSPSQIVILIFGCAELLMGFQLAGQTKESSNEICIPFWQGALVHNSSDMNA